MRDLSARVATPFLFLAKLLAWDTEAWGKVKEWASEEDVAEAQRKLLEVWADRGTSIRPPPHWGRGNLTSDPLEGPVIPPIAQFGSVSPPPRPSEDLNPTVKVRL